MPKTFQDDYKTTRLPADAGGGSIRIYASNDVVMMRMKNIHTDVYVPVPIEEAQAMLRILEEAIDEAEAYRAEQLEK